MKYPNSFIIFDIETTGFSGTKDKCTEIGAIKIVEGKVISTFNTLLNWNIEIPEKITQLTGITKELLDKEGIDPDMAFAKFMQFISGGEILMGHNILKFDIPFLEGNFGEFVRLGDEILDIAALYKAKKLGISKYEAETYGAFAKRVLSQVHYGVKYSIDTACVEFKIDKSKITQHRALGDCHLTHEIFKNLINDKVNSSITA